MDFRELEQGGEGNQDRGDGEIKVKEDGLDKLEECTDLFLMAETFPVLSLYSLSLRIARKCSNHPNIFKIGSKRLYLCVSVQLSL